MAAVHLALLIFFCIVMLQVLEIANFLLTDLFLLHSFVFEDLKGLIFEKDFFFNNWKENQLT